MKLFSTALIIMVLAAGIREESACENEFYKNWDIAPKEGAFKMDGWSIWGGSVIKIDDDEYYMYATRWPEELSWQSWATNAEIVLAKANTPEGPYQFEKVILPPRGKEFWDGRATLNPTIIHHKGKYLLYYVGITYDFKQPVDSKPTRDMYEEAWNSKRIGLAIADSPDGPWERKDEPILHIRSGKWDGAITSNPAPVVHEDGSVLLIYKSAPVPYPERNQNRAMRLGVVKAKHYSGSYERIEDNNQIKLKPIDTSIEDPFIWQSNDTYYMIAKCMNESITGEKGAGFLACSRNGIEWTIAEQPKAYSRTVELSDGSIKEMPKLERPQVFFENGQPTLVFFGARDDEDKFYNLVRPLK
ncbi:MAG TPA: glycoside hydrolase family protein [Bacteroidales bacterium]|nr:glycoside hydrolase family protein [Bacteroidales bacterium]